MSRKGRTRTCDLKNFFEGEEADFISTYGKT
jgi:hypothetical protein